MPLRSSAYSAVKPLSVPRSAFRLPRLLLLGVVLCCAPAVQEQDLDQEVRQLQGSYAKAIEELAAWCEGKGLPAQAKSTRAVLGMHDPFKCYVAILPKQVGPPPLPDDAPADVHQWNTRLLQLRQKQADAPVRAGAGAARRPSRVAGLPTGDGGGPREPGP